MARAVNPAPQILDDAGNPFVDAKLFTFESGTSTLKDTFADANQTIANPNPVLIPSNGRWPNIFFTGIAKQIMTATVDEVPDQQIWERDPVGDNKPNDSISNWSALIIYNINDLVQGTDAAFYKSITDGNTNNDPTTSPAFWEEFKLITVWNTNVPYVLSAIVIGSDGLMYRSLEADNKANDPTSSPTEWGSTTSPIGTDDIQDGAVTFAKLDDDVFANIATGQNGIINGALDHWQREVTFSTAMAASYNADRWQFAQTILWTGTITRQGTAGNYRSRVQRTAAQTAEGTAGLSTVLTNEDSARFAGKNITVSFIGKAGANYSPTSNNLRFNIRTGEGVDESCSPLAGFPTTPGDDNDTIQLTTSDVVYSATFAVPSSTTQLSFQWWMLALGTAGADDWFELGEVKIEEGSIATPFIRNSGTVEGELAACQKYYFKTYQQNVFPGDVSSLRGAGTGRAYAAITGGVHMPFSYPVTMRSIPTVAVFATESGTSGSIRNETANTDISFDFTGVRDGQRGVTVRNTGTVSLNDTVGCHVTAEAEL